MEEDKIHFSVIIPTYNRAKFIGRTLQSVLNQHYQSFEIIVVDDGGTDNTKDVVHQIGSSKIKYYYKKNEERGAARNYGISKASGEYITFLDSDDILYNDHLEEAYKFIGSKNKPYCFAQAYEVRHATTNKLITKAYSSSTPTVNKQLLNGNILSCFGVFVKRELLKELNFEEDRSFAGTEDWLLWLQISAQYPIPFNNKITGSMLEHESRSVLSFKEESLIYRTELIKKRLSENAIFVSKYGNSSIRKIYAHMLTYTSLHLAMSRKKSAATKYWLKGISTNIRELFTRRSLAIAKKLVFS